MRMDECKQFRKVNGWKTQNFSFFQSSPKKKTSLEVPESIGGGGGGGDSPHKARMHNTVHHTNHILASLVAISSSCFWSSILSISLSLDSSFSASSFLSIVS